MKSEEGSILSQSEDEQNEKKRKHRTYQHRVTWVIIIVCCGLFLGGISVSGIRIDDFLGKSRLFDPAKHVCVQESWLETTSGEKTKVKFCIEWIDMTDPSGRTHVMPVEKLEIFMGPDGNIRTYLKQRINYGLVTAFIYLILIIIGGRMAQEFLFHRHRRQMGLQI